MMKVLTDRTIGMFENEKNKNLWDLTILLLQYWLNEMAEYDSFILKASVKIVNVMIDSPKLWTMLK